MILLKVWLESPRGEHREVGHLACGDADVQGWYTTQFAYVESWRSDPGSFDLQPKRLERARYNSKTPAQSRNFYPPLSVFEDAAPDTWGRSLLIRLRRLPEKERTIAHFLREIGPNGLGAFSFGPDEATRAPRQPAARSTTLAQLVRAAADFESGKLERVTPSLERLLAAGASPGGTRPKAVVEDEAGAGWIAKFPSGADTEGARARGVAQWDIVALEATCMALARDAGLHVPDTRLQPLGSKKALLVRRFDIPEGGRGRKHMLSFKTLCSERPGSPALAYTELYAQLLDVSCQPAKDVPMLFRHMVVNAAIGNTDDHLKNFWILRDEEGWKLSPAIDLVPAGLNRREHQLNFLNDMRCPRGGDLIELGRHWKVKPSRVRGMVEEVVQAFGNFESRAATLGVREDNIPEVARDIRDRSERLTEGLQP